MGFSWTEDGGFTARPKYVCQDIVNNRTWCEPDDLVNSYDTYRKSLRI